MDHTFEEGTLTSKKQDLRVAASTGSSPIMEQRWSSRMVLAMVYFSFVVSYRLGPTSFFRFSTADFLWYFVVRL